MSVTPVKVDSPKLAAQQPAEVREDSLSVRAALAANRQIPTDPIGSSPMPPRNWKNLTGQNGEKGNEVQQSDAENPPISAEREEGDSHPVTHRREPRKRGAAEAGASSSEAASEMGLPVDESEESLIKRVNAGSNAPAAAPVLDEAAPAPPVSSSAHSTTESRYLIRQSIEVSRFAIEDVRGKPPEEFAYLKAQLSQQLIAELKSDQPYVWGMFHYRHAQAIIQAKSDQVAVHSGIAKEVLDLATEACEYLGKTPPISPDVVTLLEVSKLNCIKAYQAEEIAKLPNRKSVHQVKFWASELDQRENNPDKLREQEFYKLHCSMWESIQTISQHAAQFFRGLLKPPPSQLPHNQPQPPLSSTGAHVFPQISSSPIASLSGLSVASLQQNQQLWNQQQWLNQLHQRQRQNYPPQQQRLQQQLVGPTFSTSSSSTSSSAGSSSSPSPALQQKGPSDG